MAGPRPDPQDSPSLRCYGNAAIFISLFMMLKALTLFQRGQAGSALTLNAAPSPRGLGRKGVMEGKAPPGAPLHQGTV